MTEIQDPAKRDELTNSILTELLPALFDTRDDEFEVSLTVTRGFDRKGHRSTRAINGVITRYSAGDNDTVVLTLSATHAPDSLAVLTKNTASPTDDSGEPGIRVRVELDHHSEVGARALVLAQEQLNAERDLAKADIDAQLASLQKARDAL